MSYLHNLLLYQPITPLHVGCGQDVGVVDLPVIRERTGYPFIPGSGLRGSLRQAFTERDGASVMRLFGPTAEESENGPRHAGCVAVHDARLLLFPVRSDRAPFLWITCPAVLSRFSREVWIFLADAERWAVQSPASPTGEELLGAFMGDGQVCLEEMESTVQAPHGLDAWLAAVAAGLEIPDLAARTVVVSDSAFHYFVTHATQVVQHNRLTSAKTVAQGQLFSVEAVPPEAVFYGFLGVTDPRRPLEDKAEEAAGEEAKQLDGPATREEAIDALRGFFTGSAAWLQLGGDEGTGLGVTRLVWASAGGTDHES